MDEIDKKLGDVVENGDCDEARDIFKSYPMKLHEQPFHYSWLHFAAENDDVEMMKLLVELGLDINTRASKSTSVPLNVAIFENAVNAVRYLLSQGADVNSGGGLEGGTPLVSACREGNLEIVNLLIDNGANVNTTFGPSNEYTALSYAIMYKRKDIEHYLRSKGALLPDEIEQGNFEA